MLRSGQTIRVCLMSMICWETSARRQLAMAVRSSLGTRWLLLSGIQRQRPGEDERPWETKRKTPVWGVVCLKPWEGVWQDSVSKRRVWLPRSMASESSSVYTAQHLECRMVLHFCQNSCMLLALLFYAFSVSCGDCLPNPDPILILAVLPRIP